MPLRSVTALFEQCVRLLRGVPAPVTDGPGMDGLRCPLCCRRHVPGFRFSECQSGGCSNPPAPGRCLCHRCYVKLLQETVSDPEGETAWTPASIGSLASLNPGVPIDHARPMPGLKPVAPPSTRPISSRERELFAAVAESPDDDAPRRALSDFLVELGDPQGELISLQLRFAQGLPKQIGEPMREKILLGRRAEFLPPGVELEGAVFNRGVLTSCRLGGPTAPAHTGWYTVERLDCLGMAPPYELLRSGLPRVSELTEVSAAAFQALAEGPPRPRLRVLDLSIARGDLAGVLAELDRFPHLTTLGLCEVELEPGDLGELLSRVRGRLATLQLQARCVPLASAVEQMAQLAPDLLLSLRVARHPLPTWLDLHRGTVTARPATITRWLDDYSYTMKKCRELGLDKVTLECEGKTRSFP